jgi:hypothetical protein
MSLSLREAAAAVLAKQRVFSRAMSKAARVLNPASIKGRVVPTHGWVRALQVRCQDVGLKVQFEQLTPLALWPSNCH